MKTTKQTPVPYSFLDKLLWLESDGSRMVGSPEEYSAELDKIAQSMAAQAKADDLVSRAVDQVKACSCKVANAPASATAHLAEAAALLMYAGCPCRPELRHELAELLLCIDLNAFMQIYAELSY